MTKGANRRKLQVTLKATWRGASDQGAAPLFFSFF